MKWDITDEKLRELLFKGEFGLEMESLRVDGCGHLAQTPHPFEENPNITRDFCENQTEMITDVFENIDGVIGHLTALQQEVNEKLEMSGEMLWRFSNPPSFSSPDDIPIADFKGSVYRDYLAGKYGKVKMLLSGIHLNYSLPSEVFDVLSNAENKSVREIKDDIYLDLSAKLLSYSWLIVYLTAASPVIDDSFLKYQDISKSYTDKFASVRCSEFGYWNYFVPTLDYSSLNKYVQSIEKYIDNGEIISCSELYYPLRLKPRGKYDLERLKENGINHVELRMLDLNPLSEIGVFIQDLEFIHLLILYLLFSNLPLPDSAEQSLAVRNMQQAALINDNSPITICGYELSLKTAAALELHRIADFAAKYFPRYLSAVTYQLAKINGKRYAEIIKNRFADDYMEKGLKLAQKYQRGDSNVHAVCGQCRGKH